MSAPIPLEKQILTPAIRVLDAVASTPDVRLEILEAAAAELGGFTLGAYRRTFDEHYVLSSVAAKKAANKLLDSLGASAIPLPLALSALASPQLDGSMQKKSGAYYTDFRLAQHIASSVAACLVRGARLIDPAAGTGILLVAATLEVCDRRIFRPADWLAESVTAWDLSSDALRGARLALASVTEDLSVIKTMSARWRCHDSLLTDNAAWNAFDVVIGNPPWEKLKLTRHEFVKATGAARHYGADYSALDETEYSAERNDLAQYCSTLADRYPLLGRGEPDLYKAFLELFLRLACPQGRISVLVPAGLIRSQGTEELRRFLIANAGDLAFTILENRARFFAIDTRFKFLTLTLTKATAKTRHSHFSVIHAKGTADKVVETGRTRIARKALQAIRPDLTVPEVRSKQEWRVFSVMSSHSKPLDKEAEWGATIVREVDMTRDKKLFSRSAGTSKCAVVEGRMVHQHRFGAKAYRCGTGRRARWDVVPSGTRTLTPQFWCPAAKLPPAVRNRIALVRAGFCDITGQTNERSMLAALVPPGVVCGNKVPTVTFPNDKSDNRLLLWLAIVNSIPFDWALRRIVTTTVNYFLLNSVPFPDVNPDTQVGRRLVRATRALHHIVMGESRADPWRTAKLRVAIDVEVHAAYGLRLGELELMLSDFPLLDRGQPAIAGEQRSTITRDFLLLEAAKRFGNACSVHAERVRVARRAGAIPYVPSEFVLAETDIAAEVSNV
jgi:Alw26I/Eco31I/Esp3I family type II restriction m6 adenine DNA methyltransferase